MTALRVAALALCTLLLVPAARADNDTQARARAHFDAGRALYSLGDFESALREFTAGYLLEPRPHFLLDVAQTYRKLGQNDKARAAYERYLRDVPPSDLYRQDVLRILAELPESPPAPTAVTPAPAPSPVAAAPSPYPVTSAPAAAALADVAAPAPKKSFVRRRWWLFPVAGVALAGLAVGIYFAVRPTVDCGSASLGCIGSR